MQGRAKAAAERWQDPEAARRYARERFGRQRAGARDARLVSALLARHGVEPGPGGILDAPCGTGRLRAALARFGVPVVGLDASPAMLAESEGARRLVGALPRLPFSTGSFDVVVCCRLLHHLGAQEELAAAIEELVRVSRRLVIASFWDAASLAAWRRRSGLRRDASGRAALARPRLEQLFRRAGADVIDCAHSFRFVSMQAFALARKRG